MIMTHGSLFSGIGGFDLAAEWAGWDNIFHCEIEPFPQRVLKYYWPNAISYGDITQTDFTIYRGQIDVLTGGFPCQPFSLAGKRKGTEDHRNLWPEMLRAIQEIQPVWIVGENVPGLINWSGGLVFEQVQVDLENEGYEVTPYILPACSKDAPHKRERVWFVAYSGNINCSIPIQQRRQNEAQNVNADRKNESGTTSNTGSKQLQKRTQKDFNENREENESGMDNRIKRPGNIGNAADTCRKGYEGSKRRESPKQCNGEKTFRSASKRFEISTWDKWPTQSPVCSGDDGFSSGLDNITFPKWRNESIKAYGNAIVPQVVYQIFKVINEMSK
jgi:DNA (cytosine-5)-methyltransferase 1